MKRLVLFLHFFLLIIVTISQTIILEEDFEYSTSLPAGWSEITTSSYPQWSFSEVGNTHYLVIPYHSNIAYLNEGDVDKQWPGEYLVAPPINLSGISSAYLSLDVFFKAMTYQGFYEVFSIEVSTDGGNSWSTLMNINPYFNWHKVYCDLTAYCGFSNIKIAFKFSDGGGWLYGVGIDNVKIQVPYDNDVALQNINRYNFVLINETIEFQGIIRNLGTIIIQSLDVSWRVNGGNIHSINFNSMNLSSMDTMSFIHSTPWIPKTQEGFDIDIWVSDPNGIPDANPSNDTLHMHVINAVSSKPNKNVFLEVFGATWCTICPHAASVISEINNSTDKLIVAVVHIDDPYTCTTGTEIFENYHLFPGWLVTGLIDRYTFYGDVSMDMDRYLWPRHVDQREDNISPVEITMNNSYDPSTRELEIDLTAIFRCSLMGDFRINCYIVEDSIISRQDNILTLPDREPYCHKDYWVYNPPGTIENYIHMNVLRDVLGGAWGTAGSLPNYVIDSEPYDFHYEYLVSGEYNANNLRIIGVIQKYNSDSSKCEVYNAMDMHLNHVTNTNFVNSKSSSISIYPNPAHTMLYLENTNGSATYSIFNTAGRELISGQVNNSKIFIGDLVNGIYLLSINSGEGMELFKFIKQ